MPRNQFAMSFPALNGEYVLQGHVDYCADNGHATHSIVDADGNVVSVGERCPRCGTLTAAPAESVAETVIKAVFFDCLESHGKTTGEIVVEFRTAEIAAERAAQLAPVVSAVWICPNPTWIGFTR